MLVGASMVGAVWLPFAGMAAGVAGAEPAPGPALDASGQPLPVDAAAEDQQRADEQSNTTTDNGAILPANIGDEIARGLSNLPPPNLSGLPAPQLNVPVNIGLPGIGLGLVPDLSVPIVLGGLAAPQLPAIAPIQPLGPPQIPGIAPIQPLGPPQIPGIAPIQPLGPPKLPF